MKVLKKHKKEKCRCNMTPCQCYVCTPYFSTFCTFVLKCIYMTSNFVNYLHIQTWLLHKITDSKSFILLMIETHVTKWAPTRWNDPFAVIVMNVVNLNIYYLACYVLKHTFYLFLCLSSYVYCFNMASRNWVTMVMGENLCDKNTVV